MTAPQALGGPAPVVASRPEMPASEHPPTKRLETGTGAGPSRIRRLGAASAETYLAIGVVTIVALLIVPLPPVMLDALLALSIGLSILVLLVAISSNEPLDFSVFPSLLLLVTLLRLGLNVSSTRLILSTGHAGRVIESFGNFVIGGNYVVGLVIFLILVAINFMVITKGAGRIAEVAARFTLDAMPGRQMSIDADLSAGLIDETEAKARREEISRHADFFGAMDGAAKFVRGDAAAGLVITAINLVGGFVIGMSQQGLSAGESLQTYTMLTVGDGLVTQIPALIVSTAAGMLVTYGSSNPAIGLTLGNQLTRSPRVLMIAGGILGVFAIVPGLPTFPFLLLAAAGLGGGYMARQRAARAALERQRAEEADAAPAAKPAGAPMKDLLAVEPLELEIGYALVPLVDEADQGDLLKRISLTRQKLAVELGIIVPPARVRDNIQLPATEYVIKLRGVRVAGGEVMPRFLLAIDTTGSKLPIDGIQTTDPSFGMDAVWITTEQRLEAESMGATVVEPATVISTHLMETVRQHSADLLSRQHTRELLDGLKEKHPALVDDVVPSKLSLGTVHRVLQRLLKEGIPIRDLVSILEALSDAADQTKDPETLTEHVRRSLGTVIAQLHSQGDGSIRGITVGPRLEASLMHLFSPRPLRDGGRTMDPEELTDALRRLSDLAQRHYQDGQWPALITSPSLRVGVRRLVEPVLPKLPVLSLGELPTQAPILSLATWEVARAA
ncbi:MAG: flagellar biosynthesis protein FlhA [Gemmatimonadales bacterium]